MPLLASGLGSPVGPPPVTAPKAVPLRVAYVDPDGETWAWSARQGILVTSVTGLGSPAAGLTSLALPTGDLLAQSVTPGGKQIVIGLYVWDDDQSALLDRIDAIARSLWHERAGLPAAGTIVIERPGGTSRQIDVMCTSGTEQTEDTDTQDAYQRWTTYGLTFQPMSPYWQDDTDTTQVFRAAPSDAGILPLLPVKLSPSVVLGETSITNNGDADAWPVWTITGPGTPTITNTTTDRSFGLDAALSEGEVVTVDTRPGSVSAVDDDGDDRWSDLVKSSPRDLWQLVPGVNELNLQMTGSGDGTSIQLAYRRRWLRA